MRPTASGPPKSGRTTQTPSETLAAYLKHAANASVTNEHALNANGLTKLRKRNTSPPAYYHAGTFSSTKKHNAPTYYPVGRWTTPKWTSKRW